MVYNCIKLSSSPYLEHKFCTQLMGISSQLPKPINTQTHLPFSLFLFCCYIINQARPRTTYIYGRKKTTIIFSMSMLSARYLSNALALLYTTCNSSRPITEQLPYYKNHINIYCGIWIIRFIRQIGHWKKPPSPTS